MQLVHIFSVAAGLFAAAKASGEDAGKAIMTHLKIVNEIPAMSLSTVFSTNTVTVTDCAEEGVTDCPVSYTTQMVEVSTTLCPITLTSVSTSMSTSAAPPPPAYYGSETPDTTSIVPEALSSNTLTSTVFLTSTRSWTETVTISTAYSMMTVPSAAASTPVEPVFEQGESMSESSVPTPPTYAVPPPYETPIETSAVSSTPVEPVSEQWKSVSESSASAPPAYETPIETSTETPIQTSTETPVETLTKTPMETSTETSVEVLTKTPMETSTETSVEVLTNTPMETSTETPLETPSASSTTGIAPESSTAEVPEIYNPVASESSSDIVPESPSAVITESSTVVVPETSTVVESESESVPVPDSSIVETILEVPTYFVPPVYAPMTSASASISTTTAVVGPTGSGSVPIPSTNGTMPSNTPAPPMQMANGGDQTIDISLILFGLIGVASAAVLF